MINLKNIEAINRAVKKAEKDRTANTLDPNVLAFWTVGASTTLSDRGVPQSEWVDCTVSNLVTTPAGKTQYYTKATIAYKPSGWYLVRVMRLRTNQRPMPKDTHRLSLVLGTAAREYVINHAKDAIPL